MGLHALWIRCCPLCRGNSKPLARSARRRGFGEGRSVRIEDALRVRGRRWNGSGVSHQKSLGSIHSRSDSLQLGRDASKAPTPAKAS
jgi:hypothetical protein